MLTDTVTASATWEEDCITQTAKRSFFFFFLFLNKNIFPVEGADERSERKMHFFPLRKLARESSYASASK